MTMKHYASLCTAAMLLGTASLAQTLAEQRSVRQVMELHDGWRFIQNDTLKGAEAPSYNDSAWPAVSVPHTWNRVGNQSCRAQVSARSPSMSVCFRLLQRR